MRTITILMGFVWGACASGGSAVKPVESAPVADGAPAQSWLASSGWAKLGDVAQVMPGFVPTPKAFSVDVEATPMLWAAVADKQLPAAVRKLRGQRMIAVQVDGSTCDAVLGRVVVGRLFHDHDMGFQLLFDGSLYDDEGEVIEVLSDADAYAKALETHTLSVFVELTSSNGERLHGCDEQGTVHHVTSSPVRSLAKRSASAAELEAGLAVLREHGFWEVQQAAYQRSVEHLRESSRRDYEREVEEAKKRRASKAEIAEIERDTRADSAPATWDVEGSGDWGAGDPEGTVWSDAGAQFLLVQSGNDMSCAAPRAWMLFRSDAGELTPLDFGVTAVPVAVLGRGDGFEVMTSWPESLARVVDERLVTFAELERAHQVNCGFYQIQPVSDEPR